MSFSKDYTFIERMLHYIAFSSTVMQKALHELDNDLFIKKIEGVESKHEVFITGLPRAGTTLVLNLLYGTHEFTTFTYRQMPFILSPLIWNTVSSPFQKEGEKKERAHGDAVEVSFDSPEAFEEIIWLVYMKKKIVRQNFLAPLSAGDGSQELADALRCSIKKLFCLSRNEDMPQPENRYLSKNNANISRIELIMEIFPSATVLVPFRNPLAHVSSLMKQHERFSGEHKKDKFSRRYMKWLGHFEFGDNFKPINFDGWLDEKEFPLQVDRNFWLEYWTTAYRHVLKNQNENIHLLDFDGLLLNGTASLERLADCVNVHTKEKLVAGAETLRAPTTQPIDSFECSETTLKAAREVHERLKARAI